MVKKILLADDDIDDTELFCEAAADIDPSIDCTYASDGREVMDKLKEADAPLPDLIVLDINMPGMNGWECLAQLKATDEYKEIPVIMYSTSSLSTNTDMASALGALHFFTKPDNYIALRESLHSIISGLNNGSFLAV